MTKAAVSADDRTTGFWRDRCGVVAVSVAVLLPVLIGFAGLGIEVGMWFWIQRQNQSAADAAAISAGLEYAAQIESGVATDPTAAATTAANCNLFSTSSSSSNAVCPLPSSASNTITLYPCYGFTVGSSCNTSSSNGAPLNAVQVALTQPLNTTFANIVTAIWRPNINTVNVRTTAIAAFPMLPHGQTCLLGVGNGSPPTGNTFSAATSATVNMPNCILGSLSTSGNSIQLSAPGSLTINAAAVATAGNILTDSGSNPPNTHTNFPLQDPYKSVSTSFSAPAPPGSCVPWNGGTPTPGTYYCGINLGSGNVTFSAGTYYIGSGGINISGSAVVTFGPGLYYLYGGSFTVTGLFSLNTTAPTNSGRTLTFCTTCTSDVAVGMAVTDATYPHLAAIPSGTTVTAVVNGQVTLSNPVVSPGVSLNDAIQFTNPLRGSVSGTGITIVLTASGGGSAGSVDIEASNACTATISLSGPGQGLLPPSPTASQGLLFFQDPTAGPAPGNTITTSGCGSSNVTLNGAIYTPASKDTLQGNFGSCTEFIAQSFTFSGNLGVDDTGCSGITLNQAQIQQVYLAM